MNRSPAQPTFRECAAYCRQPGEEAMVAVVEHDAIDGDLGPQARRRTPFRGQVNEMRVDGSSAPRNRHLVPSGDTARA